MQHDLSVRTHLQLTRRCSSFAPELCSSSSSLSALNNRRDIDGPRHDLLTRAKALCRSTTYISLLAPPSFRSCTSYAALHSACAGLGYLYQAMGDQGSGLVGQVVAPGDAVQALPATGSIRIGTGLRADDGYVVAQKCGIVRQTRNGKLWLESRQKRYLPAEEDLVVGVITDRRGENFILDIGGPFPGQLPMLSFEGATRRNRPNLNAGDLVYARVVTANRDLDPVLSCVDGQGKAGGFGPLKEGLVIECSTYYARTLLARPPPPVLAAVGAKLQFELAVGMNGRVWLNSSSCATTVTIPNIILDSQHVPTTEQQQWVKQTLQ